MTVTIRIQQATIESRRGEFQSRYFPPNLNGRMHWAVRSKWTAAFKQEIWAALQQKHSEVWELLKTRTTKPVVNITFYTCHIMDYDNAYGSAKPLLDALKGQVIDDDKPDKLTLYVTQERVKHLK